MNSSDATLSYVLAAQPVHVSLREALIQVAAFALLKATGSPRAAIDISPLDRAREALTDPAETLGTMGVPGVVKHHHHHLSAALDALNRAMTSGYSANCDADNAFFAAVEEAERHVRAANRLPPGFEIVDLTQACCATHAHGGVEAPTAN